MRLLITCLILFLSSGIALAAEGMVNVKSSHPVDVTADRLVNALNSKGMTVFIRVDHTAGAEKAGLELRPTEVVIFGNPKAGTPLMRCQQTVGIDLPQKALIWQDAADQVWLSYNDPAYLADRHAIEGCTASLAKVSKVLSNFATAATGP